MLSGIAFVLMLAARLVLSVLQRWPLAVFGGALGIGLATAIIINAVRLQEGEHPSPMFASGRALTSVSQKIAPVTKAKSLPPPRPQAAPAPQVMPVSQLAQTSTVQAPAAAVAPAKTRAMPEDPIARLLANGSPPPQPAKSAQDGILQVQQALVKLGYAITPDGRTGPATQKAIEAFEKLEALPITGDPLNSAMRKALAVASGMAL